MKVKKDFMLREIAGSWIIIPLGVRIVEFNGIMTLSGSGALLWRRLEEDAELSDLIQLIKSEYNVDDDIAAADVQEFVTALKEKDLLD